MMQAKQNAWVFGATGLTGRSVVQTLCLTGVHCYAHLRPNSSSRAFVEPMFRECGAHIAAFDWQISELKAAFNSAPPSVVFLTLGTTNSRAKLDGQGHRTVDYGLTKMVLDVLGTDYPSTEVVYLSAVRSVGASLSDYFRIRVEIEAELAEHNGYVLIAQPALITGPRVDVRPWEHRAAVATNKGLDLLSTLGLTSMARRYRSLDGETLGRGMVQLWREKSPCGIADVEALTQGANRFARSLA